MHRGRTITFGIESAADIRAEQVQLTDQGVRFTVDGVQFESALLGRHSILNILAGLAVASLYGIRPAQLTGVVKDLAAPSMRGQRLVHDGILILNDCYNSNPDAARVMIDVLRDTPAKRRIAVLGEMLELGRWSESLHRDVGSYVAKSGIDVLVGIRGEACHLVDAARQAGLAVDAAFFFPDAGAAGEHLRRIAHPGDVILFKGSRGTHVEHALERFLARPELECSTGCSTKSCFATSRHFACSSTPLFELRSPPDGAVLVPGSGAVADRQAARVSNRPVHSRRRTEVAHEEGRHAHHGRNSDHHLDRDSHAAVGES